MFEIVPLVNVGRSLLDRLSDALRRSLGLARLPSAYLTVYVVGSHDETRKILGLSKQMEYEESDVKLFIDQETGEPVISVLFRSIDDPRLIVKLARELVTYEIVMDPMSPDVLLVTEHLRKNKYATAISLALLRRVVDKTLIERGLRDDLMQEFHESRKLIREILGQRDERLKAVCLLAVDIPLSFELSGDLGTGRQLYVSVMREFYQSHNGFLERYEDFRNFVRKNVSLESAANILELLF